MLSAHIIQIFVLITIRSIADSITNEDEAVDFNVVAKSPPDLILPIPRVRDTDYIKRPTISLKESKRSHAHIGKPTTYAFIENIVQRTVAKYMHVIRTQRDWLQRLLQLVREERAIRSKYNCSTDACIYKIQLFTHHLPPSLFHMEPVTPTHRKRIRRSVQMPTPQNPETAIKHVIESAMDDEYPDTRTNIESPSQDPNDTMNPSNTVIHADDALRVPESFEISMSQNDSHKSDNVRGLLESGSHPQTSHFEHAGKINMERVRHEVLTEALSRKNKPNPVKKQPGVLEPSAEITSSTVTPGTEAETDIVTEEIKQNTSEYGLEVPEPSSATTMVHNIRQTETPNDVVKLLSEDTTTINPNEGEDEILENVFDSDEDESLPDPSLLEPTVEEDMSIPAIPFGLNKFGGRPYENCTGRFENYCYNALKCVYISVLETAACYCRTGYTGVRCDMFNLPQTLDILKSFREEVVDIPSLRQPNALTLYNVVEATARYTVNAVLEEDLLSSWNDDSLS